MVSWINLYFPAPPLSISCWCCCPATEEIHLMGWGAEQVIFPWHGLPAAAPWSQSGGSKNLQRAACQCCQEGSIALQPPQDSSRAWHATNYIQVRFSLSLLLPSVGHRTQPRAPCMCHLTLPHRTLLHPGRSRCHSHSCPHAWSPGQPLPAEQRPRLALLPSCGAHFCVHVQVTPTPKAGS